MIIWLGQSDPESVDAIRLISENVDVALTGLLSHEPINFNDPAIFNRYDRKPFNEYQWKAILVLFRRRWFRRVWTLQEAALATRSVAYCGSETFHIDNATVFASFLVNHSWDQRLYHLGTEMPYENRNGLVEAAIINAWIGCQWRGSIFGNAAVMQLFPSIHAYQHASGLKIWLSALYMLVQHLRCREATQKEDKILVALTLALKYAPQTVIPAVKDLMDDKPAERLYLDFTVFMIKYSDSLDILSQLDRDKETRSRHPSWVPDFSRSGSTTLIQGTSFEASKNIGNFCRVCFHSRSLSLNDIARA